MLCPSCGAEVAASKFCENCGNPLPLDQGAPAPIEQPTEPTPPAQPTEPTEPAQPAQPAQPTEPVPAYVPEVPGDSAWEAQSQQAYQVGQTAQMPPQGAPVGYDSSSGAPQAPYQQAAPFQPVMPPAGQAPNAAFVLVVVGLVLSVLFVTFVPGLVCSIIGLVLNAGYNKKGLFNPRKTATTVVGVIGIVVAVLCLVTTIAIGVVAAQVVDEIDRQGVNLSTDSVEVTTDSDGHINVSVNGSSGATDASASASSAAASAASALAAGLYEDEKYHDGEWNPTLYALLELTGAEFSDLLESYNFAWNSEFGGWMAPDDSLYLVYKGEGLLSKSQIADLPKGAAGEAVAMALVVEGYDDSEDALKELSSDVTVEAQTVVDDTAFAVVRNSAGVRYLFIVTESNDAEQTLFAFTEESIKGGLFESLIGVNAGASIDEVWKAITG